MPAGGWGAEKHACTNMTSGRDGNCCEDVGCRQACLQVVGGSRSVHARKHGEVGGCVEHRPTHGQRVQKSMHALVGSRVCLPIVLKP
jgi:hypothetical protein